MASIFTKILNGEIPGKIIHQDEHCAAIRDINPQASTHVLVFPKREIQSLATLEPGDAAVVGHMLMVVSKLARDLKIADDGYRLVINTGDNGGQTVSHLHMHLIGGRPLSWPPG